MFCFQLFSDRSAAAMEVYKDKDEPLLLNLKDSDPTIAFIRRIHNLIEAMMSRIPKKALYPHPKNCKHREAIEEFLDYFIEWQRQSEEHGRPFVPNNTRDGIKISLQATLELLDFLSYVENLKFAMTARLNQDAFWLG